MMYSRIADTNLNACKIVLGTHTFGTTTDKDLAFALLDKYVELGGNMLDTASAYANWMNLGKSMSEKTIGEWIESRNNREKIIISTKGGHHDMQTGASRLSVEELKYDFEQSLINLKTDYIDIYWLHKDDVTQSPEALIENLNKAVDLKKVRCLGASNWKYDRIIAANEYALKNGLAPIKASQIMHNFTSPNSVASDILAMDPDEYKKYCADNLDMFAFSAQAGGFFAIMEKSGFEGLSPSAQKNMNNEHNMELYKRVSEIAKEKNVSASATALALLIKDKKLNTFAQIGPLTIEQLVGSFEALKVQISDEQRNYILDDLNY